MRRMMLTYELNANALRKNYPAEKGAYTDAYTVIRQYILGHGFEDDKDFGYIMNKALTEEECRSFALDMLREFPWLKGCFTRFEILELGETVDMTDIIKNAQGTE